MDLFNGTVGSLGYSITSYNKYRIMHRKWWGRAHPWSHLWKCLGISLESLRKTIETSQDILCTCW